MNFWANKIGRPQAPVTPPPTPAHQQYVPTQRPWWDSTPAPQPQIQQPQTQFQVPRQAKGVHELSDCPECGSGDYMGSPASPNARKRCFSCGYPYVQSGSGSIGATSSGGPTHASPQIHDGSSQFVPGFIAHIDNV